jgi:hypothetical protein
MQYPNIGQPQYGFAPTMPGMAGGGLASLPVKRFQSGGASTAPRYSYNPITQSYTLLTPKQQFNQGSDGGVYPSGQYGSFGEGTPADTNSGWSQMTPTDQAAYYAANPTMAAVTQTGLNALGVTSLGMLQNALDPIGVAQAHTIAQGINPTLATPVENPAVQQVTPIDPVQTANLAAMNQQQQTTSPSAVATAFADTVMGAVQDAEDAEQGAAMNAVSAPTAPTAAPDNAPTSTSTSSDNGGPSGNQFAGNENHGMFSDNSFTESAQFHDNMMSAGFNDSTSSEGTDGASPSYNRGGQIMNYEQGGLAAAQQTQSKGRGQDTMLVHMTPGEVKGLQALAMSQGGSLTINPQTGLPEAGFLSSILPMVAGFALGPAGFGLMSSLQAGLAVGALTGVATGSLKKGLMAGLGAYGGAGIGEGLVGAANATTPVTTGAEAGLTSASEMAASNLSPELLNSPITTNPSISGIDPGLLESSGLTPKSPYFKMAQSNIDPGLLEGMGGTPGMTAQQVATAPVINPTPSIPVSPTTGFESAGTGFKNMFDTGQVGTDARSAFMKSTPTGTLPAAGMTVASALTPEPAPLPKSKSFIRPYSVDITNPSGTPMYTPQDTRERAQVQYAFKPEGIYQAAQGGLTALNGQTYDDEYGRDEYDEGGSVQKRKSRSLKGNPYYRFAQDRKDSSMEAAVEQNFAKGGLGAVLPPRFLSGGGDGMSDSIKANIDGKQEARLADGEFVVPADVVSHLGNGSSKAGAKKLYAMMDKIRKARTGRTRQAPEVNARRYMPA